MPVFVADQIGQAIVSAAETGTRMQPTPFAILLQPDYMDPIDNLQVYNWYVNTLYILQRSSNHIENVPTDTTEHVQDSVVFGPRYLRPLVISELVHGLNDWIPELFCESIQVELIVLLGVDHLCFTRCVVVLRLH